MNASFRSIACPHCIDERHALAAGFKPKKPRAFLARILAMTLLAGMLPATPSRALTAPSHDVLVYRGTSKYLTAAPVGFTA